MRQHSFLEIAFTKWEQNHRVLGTYISNYYTKLQSLWKLNQIRYRTGTKKQKSRKDEKLIFQKYRWKNTIQEIMNTQVYWVKCDSPAP